VTTRLRIRVAADLCCGHHRCMELAPDVYEVVGGFNPMDGCLVPAGAEESARYGADACPEGAITLDEEGEVE